MPYSASTTYATGPACTALLRFDALVMQTSCGSTGRNVTVPSAILSYQLPVVVSGAPQVPAHPPCLPCRDAGSAFGLGMVQFLLLPARQAPVWHYGASTCPCSTGALLVARLGRATGALEVGSDLQRRIKTTHDISREEEAMPRGSWMRTVGIIIAGVLLLGLSQPMAAATRPPGAPMQQMRGAITAIDTATNTVVVEVPQAGRARPATHWHTS